MVTFGIKECHSPLRTQAAQAGDL